jgi:integrase
VNYTDSHGKRRLETFARKKDADARAAQVDVDVRAGIHTATSTSITIAEAGELWIKTGESNQLERTTLAQYRAHVALHINPLIGRVKLAKLSAPMVRAFEDALRHGNAEQAPRSAALTSTVLRSLSSLIADAQERGLVARNVARDLRRRRPRGKERRADRRQKGKLKVGVDIPTPDEIRRIIAALEGPWRPLIMTAIFTGLRASELRGLRWSDIDLARSIVHVRQRADALNKIGPPKSESGERSLPLAPGLVALLREWRLASPTSALDLAFPTRFGHVAARNVIARDGLWPAQVAAGVSALARDAAGNVKLDSEGAPVRRPKYPGLHALRHFFASWCINRKADGGLELPAKMVQARLGHASIAMTLDVYGHLFPAGDDTAELADAERTLLGR